MMEEENIFNRESAIVEFLELDSQMKERLKSLERNTGYYILHGSLNIIISFLITSPVWLWIIFSLFAGVCFGIVLNKYFSAYMISKIMSNLSKEMVYMIETKQDYFKQLQKIGIARNKLMRY